MGKTTPAFVSLRALLAVDALTCLLMGAALCIAHDLVAAVLDLPEGFVFWAGVLLLPCAMLMAVAATPVRTSVTLARLVVIGNVGW